MRHNHAIAGALVAALLAYFDVVACGQCIVYLWPYFGLKSFLIAGSIRSKYKSATPAARAGLPALRYGWSPYEFIGGSDVGLVFYPGAAVEAAAYAPLDPYVGAEFGAVFAGTSSAWWRRRRRFLATLQRSGGRSNRTGQAEAVDAARRLHI